MIYKTFEQWMDGNFLEVKEPRKKAYSKDELLLVEMGWSYGYDAGRAVEQALDKKAENARELGLDYEPSAKVRDFWEGYVPEPQYSVNCVNHDCEKCKAAAQRQWVGLTDEEVKHIADSEWEEAFVRLIEAKLKERNA